MTIAMLYALWKRIVECERQRRSESTYLCANAKALAALLFEAGSFLLCGLGQLLA
jgi:hypothetical protein